MKEAGEVISNHSALSPRKTHSLVEQSVKFGDALDSSVKRTVFMFVIMHFHDHSMQKFLFLGVRECILIKLLIEATIPLRVVYVIFGSLASLKLFGLLLQAFCLRFFNRFISRIENMFKPLQSDRGFPFEGFFQKSSHFHLFCHHTAIYSSSNSFISFDFGYFFYNKDFFAFCKVFSTSHIARGIIKLTAWTTSFLEERLDFEIT